MVLRLVHTARNDILILVSLPLPSQLGIEPIDDDTFAVAIDASLHVNTSTGSHATHFYYLVSFAFAAVSMNEPLHRKLWCHTFKAFGIYFVCSVVYSADLLFWLPEIHCWQN